LNTTANVARYASFLKNPKINLKKNKQTGRLRKKAGKTRI
jgi:hypothetical protein